MLEVSQEIKDIFRSDNTNETTIRRYKLIFYDDEIDALYPSNTLYPDDTLFPGEHSKPWLTIENDRIVSESIKLTETLSESDDLEYGSCGTSCLEVIVADVIEDLMEKEFLLVVEAGGFDITLGLYTVSSYKRQADRRKRKITAYNRMQRFNIDVAAWYNELVFPMTLRKFRDSLCAYVGVEQKQQELLFDSLQISKTIEPEELPGIDVIKAICQLNGCFGQVDREGYFKYISLSETGLYPSEDLFPDEELYPAEFGGEADLVETISTYRSVVYEDYVIDGITGLTIRGEEGDIGANVGAADNVYIIEGNFLVFGKNAAELLNIAQSLLPMIEKRIYVPAKIECNGFPWVEVGDALSIITRDDVVETYCMKRVMSGGQALKDVYESTGSKKRGNDFGINKKIIQLEGKTAVIVANVDEVSATVTDLKEYTEAQFKITADSITSEVKRAESAEKALGTRITQTATEIQTEVYNITDGLQSQITQNANEILLRVSKDSMVDDLNSELSITGNAIEFRTGNFIVDAKNLSIDESGNADFSGEIRGSDIFGSYIEGTEIYGGTIWNDYMEITEDSCQIGDWSFENLGSSDTYFEGRGISIHAGSGNISSDGDFWCDNLECNNLVNNSDRRLKKDIKDIDINKASKFILSMSPKSYHMKKNNIKSVGFVAQEVEEISKKIGIEFPVVFNDKDGYYSISYINYIPLLVSCVKYLQSEIDDLKK